MSKDNGGPASDKIQQARRELFEAWTKSEHGNISRRQDGEIAKRDEELAACRVAVENCEVFRAELAAIKEQEPIGWYTEDHLDDKSATTYSREVADRWVAKGWPVFPLYAAPVSEAKAQGVVMPAELDRAFITGESCDGVYRVVIQSETLKEMQAVHSWLARLAAAPAAPAADAGLVDMYRHLQTVTPYRFKKIQDASVTDGGDVLYFHKDRFDAALLDDMAANSANGVV